MEEPSIVQQPVPDAPRELTPAVRNRAWTEPRVRLWWMLGLGVALLMLYVLGTQAANWWAERKLITDGVAVQAVITRASDALNDITVPDKQMRPDSVCELRFELNGKSYVVRGQLPEHMEQGRHVVTGPAHPVTLHVDPDDPTGRWTDRTTSPPLLSRQMIGVAIGLPIAGVLALVALARRRGVLRVWRDGRVAPALVVGTGQTSPVAPRSRAVRCTPGDSADKRVFTAYLPAGATAVAPGDVVWVVHPPDKPEPCYAVEWFERERTAAPAATAAGAAGAVILFLACATLPGCAGRPADAEASSSCDCCPPASAPAPEPAMTQPARPSTQPTRFTGTLRGGILAAGAETTGWILETDDGKRIDVDVTKAGDAAGKLEGRRVVIIGGMTTANWVERGPKPLLIAERVEPAK